MGDRGPPAQEDRRLELFLRDNKRGPSSSRSLATAGLLALARRDASIVIPPAGRTTAARESTTAACPALLAKYPTGLSAVRYRSLHWRRSRAVDFDGVLKHGLRWWLPARAFGPG